jgi:hypothetical protein
MRRCTLGMTAASHVPRVLLYCTLNQGRRFVGSHLVESITSNCLSSLSMSVVACLGTRHTSSTRVGRFVLFAYNIVQAVVAGTRIPGSRARARGRHSAHASAIWARYGAGHAPAPDTGQGPHAARARTHTRTQERIGKSDKLGQ